MSYRGRTVGAVQDLVLVEVHGKKLLFALHVDGSLRVWDLLSRIRILNHTISIPTMTGNFYHPYFSFFFLCNCYFFLWIYQMSNPELTSFKAH